MDVKFKMFPLKNYIIAKKTSLVSHNKSPFSQGTFLFWWEAPSFSFSSVKITALLLTSSVTGEAGDVFLSKIFTWLPGNNPLWRFLPRA